MKSKASFKTTLNRITLFCKLFLRSKLLVTDFDQQATEKAIQVLRLTRMKDVYWHVFTRKSWRLFYDENSKWSYDILNFEFD